MKRFEIPQDVRAVAAALEKADFSAYLVGGCVRDLVLGAARGESAEPKDWDVATNATPEEIQKIFPDHVYENNFGTVGVKTDSENERLKVIEVTTFRIEGKYTDKRHPDEVRFAKTIEEDLSRRDFTANAMALEISEVRNSKSHTNPTPKTINPQPVLIDPFGGQEDLKKRIIRTVGEPAERFGEDALRLLRAVRFATELSAAGGDFLIESKTRRAIENLAPELGVIAKERIRDEFVKIVAAPDAARGVILLEELGLLRYILPELREGIGVGQNKHHIYTVFEHNVRALDYAAKKKYSLIVRMASLLHDLGKPKTKQGDGPNSTFHGHDKVGAKMAARALDRLKFPKDVIEHIAHLIRYHMFHYNVGEVSDAGVRRFLRRVGPEFVPELIELREADRIGSGVPKAVPYKLRHFLFMIEKVKHDPISPKMLKAKGEDVMRILGIMPGPRVGRILSVLLDEVLDDPARNAPEDLEKRILEFGGVTDAELARLAKKANEKTDEREEEIEEKIKSRHHV